MTKNYDIVDREKEPIIKNSLGRGKKMPSLWKDIKSLANSTTQTCLKKCWQRCESWYAERQKEGSS